MDIQWTTITDIVQKTPDTRTYYLDPPEGFQWQNGAHTHFALEGFYDGDKPDKSMVRHMSISTLPRGNKIGITTRIRAQKSRFKGLLDQTNLDDPIALLKLEPDLLYTVKIRLYISFHPVLVSQRLDP